MAQLIFGHEEELAAWAEGIYPDGAPFMRPLHTIGIADPDGVKLWGVAIYNNFSRTDVHYSMVAVNPRWATRGVIRAILSYPFLHEGKARMTAITSKRNKRARKVLLGIGFRQEGVHPYATPSGDTAISHGLYAHVAKEKWLNGKEL